MSRQTLVAYTPFGFRRIESELQRIADESLPAGHTMIVTVEVDDGPTAKMRGKFHAMCADIAEQIPEWKGFRMKLAHWKAVFVGAAIEQEWVPGIDGRPVPYRPSTENLSRKRYCDCITAAQAFGDSMGVVWSEKSKAEAEAA